MSVTKSKVSLAKSKILKLAALAIICALLSAAALMGGALKKVRADNVPASSWLDAGNYNTAIFGVGDGTAANPYRIDDPAELAGLAYLMQGIGSGWEDAGGGLSYNDAGAISACFKVDIPDSVFDMSAHRFTSLGNKKDGSATILKYTGRFDFNGAVITGLYIEESAAALSGLFAHLGAGGEVKNLTVKSGGIIGGDMAGGIACIADGDISDCKNYAAVTALESGGIKANGGGDVTGCVNYGSITGSGRAAGIAAYTEGDILGCVNYGTVNASTWAGGIYASADSSLSVSGCKNYGAVNGGEAGGIASLAYTDIKASANFGAVKGTVAGGIAAYNFSIIMTSYNFGRVTSENAMKSAAGGIAGINQYVIGDCYNAGAVTGATLIYTGGIAGYNGDPDSTNGARIYNGFNYGAIVGGSDTTGAIIGDYSGGPGVTTSYYDNEKSVYAGVGTGLTTASMTGTGAMDAGRLIFTNIDFEADTVFDIGPFNWVTIPGQYPMLKPNPEFGNAAGGSFSLFGTADNPFIIPDADGLIHLSRIVAGGRDCLGNYFKMASDIRLPEVPAGASNFTPIGKAGAHFSGIFDGDMHIVYGLQIVSGENNIGLFSEAYSATIKNTGVAEGSVTGVYCVGGVIGYASNYVKIINCFSAVTVNAANNGGGVAGMAGLGCEISGCFNMGSVNGNGIYIGGVAGRMDGTFLKDCYNSGSVRAFNTVGGIIGTTYSNAIAVTNCYNTGAVSATTATPTIGNILGSAALGTPVISSCYYIPAMTGLSGAVNGADDSVNEVKGLILASMTGGSFPGTFASAVWAASSAAPASGGYNHTMQLKAFSGSANANVIAFSEKSARAGGVAKYYLGSPEFVYGAKLRDIDIPVTAYLGTYGSGHEVIPGTFTWDTPDEVTTVGTVSKDVHFTPANTGLYTGKQYIELLVTVTRKPVQRPSAVTGLVFSGLQQTGVNVPDETEAIYKSGHQITQTNAGNYSTVFGLPDQFNYMWDNESLGDFTLDWSIARLPIAQPSALNVSLVYNGETQYGAPGNMTGANVSGTVWAVNAGGYEAVYTLQSNYEWDTETDKLADFRLQWSIAKMAVARPSAVAGLVYNTSLQTGVTGYSAAVMDLTSGHMSHTDADTYTAVFSLKTPLNHKWATGDEGGSASVEWSMAKKTAIKPVAIPLTFNGAEQTGVSGFGGEGFTMISGETKGTAAGSYGAVFSLIAGGRNYEWEGGSISDLPVNWQIEKKAVARPAAILGLVYNGTEQNGVSGGAAEGIVLTGGVIKGTDAGGYTAFYDLVGIGQNYKWTTGEPGDSTTVNWVIARKAIARPVQTAGLVYNGSQQNGAPAELSGTAVSGITSAAGAGENNAVYTLDQNHQWNAAPVHDVYILTWVIARKALTRPVAAALVYNKASQTGAPSIVGTGVTGVSSATDAGYYAATYTPDSNHKWNSLPETDAFTLNWTIAKKAVTVTAAAKTKVFGQADPALTYSITAGGPLLTGDAFTGAIIRAAGENAGEYTISAGTLAVNANYSVSFVSGVFTITRKPLTNELAACDTVFTYNGAEHKPAPEVNGLGLSADYTVSYSQNINAGTAIMTITGTGNYSGTLSVNFTIKKAYQDALKVTAPENISADGKAFMLTVTGGSGDGALTYTVVSGKGVTVSADGSVTVTAAGEVQIRVVKAGGGNYEETSQTVTFTAGGNKGLPAGAVIGIIAGGIVLAGAAVLCIILIKRKKRAG